MGRKRNLVPWIVAGLLILVLLYFAVQGGIGTVADDTSKRAERVVP